MAKRLRPVLAGGRARRGMSGLYSPCDVEKALCMLDGASRVAFVTGFFIASAGVAETDGPCGTAAVARACSFLGKEVAIFSDGNCASVVGAVAGWFGLPFFVVDDSDEIVRWKPDLVCFVERPGRSCDGSPRSMDGVDLSEWVRPLDDLIAPHGGFAGIPVIAVGDGGNEAGMGGLAERVVLANPGFGRYLDTGVADVAVGVEVSDWGGYAIAGLLSREGLWCGIGFDEVLEVFEVMLENGAVDGVSKARAMSVDGFGMDVQRVVLEAIEEACGSLICGGFTGST